MNYKSVAKDFMEYDFLRSKLSQSGRKTISFFGSARDVLNDSVYKSCRKLANKVASSGVNVLTGGGPGIMGAASMGAYSVNAEYSYAANIVLPHEQEPNKSQGVSSYFSNFALRNRALFDFSDAFIVYPGGFGTLYEVFAILTEMQCEMIKKSPIIVIDEDLTEPSIAYAISGAMAELEELKTISDGDCDVFNVASNHLEAEILLSKLGII